MTAGTARRSDLETFGTRDSICMDIPDESVWRARIALKYTRHPTGSTVDAMPEQAMFIYRLSGQPDNIWHYATKSREYGVATGTFIYTPPYVDAHATRPAMYGTHTSLLLACLPWAWQDQRYARWFPWFPSNSSSSLH
jgi:hypothetical protein